MAIDAAQKGALPHCQQATATVSDLVLVDTPQHSCPACPLRDIGSTKACLTAPLIHDDRRYGVLTVAFSRQAALYEEERNLIQEVSH